MMKLFSWMSGLLLLVVGNCTLRLRGGDDFALQGIFTNLCNKVQKGQCTQRCQHNIRALACARVEQALHSYGRVGLAPTHPHRSPGGGC